MRTVLLFILSTLFGSCAACTPAVAPTPPAVVVGAACEDAQKTLDKLECSWRKNSQGKTWGESCHLLADRGYPRILEVATCVSAGKTCDESKACK